MKKNMKISLIFLFAVFLFLPIFINPNIFLQRGNDLQEQFWPFLFYTKTNLLTNHSVPLWNNMFFSGMPFITDPQAPLFYLPNIVYLFLSIDKGLVFLSFIHVFLSGLGMYLLSKKGFGFSDKSSLVASLFYMLSPKLSSYVEAGHVGLINSWALIPFILLFLLKLVKTNKIKWSILFSVFLSLLFFSHLPTFIISLGLCIILFLVLLKSKRTKNKKTIVSRFLVSLVFVFGLTSISLLAQLAWQEYSTRSVLLSSKEIHPVWLSFKEFVVSVLDPLINGKQNLLSLNTEKTITLGIFPLILALFGFKNLNKKIKKILFVGMLFIVLVSMNNITPLSSLFSSFNFFLLLRVLTRFWFIVVIATCLLVGFAIEKKKGLIINILVILSLLELGFISLTIINKPIKESVAAPKEVLEFIKRDKDQFRVFCTTRCFSQKDIAVYGIETAEGYNTVQQINFYKHAWQLTGAYWNHYTLDIPPLGTYRFQDLQPDPKSLGEYNVKYVVSTHELDDASFILLDNIQDYFIYENKLFEPRSNAQITSFSPNKIVIDTSDFQEKQVIISEVFSPGWKAYLNGESEAVVQETPNALRAIDIEADTSFVELVYDPPLYKVGKAITIATFFGLLILVSISRKKDLF